MTNYICINGKKAELTEEQMKALGIELPKKPSPFNRVRENECFYYIGANGSVGVTKEHYNGYDNSCYRYGNYCTDKTILEQRALHETLNRLLWRYSMEHDGDKMKWISLGNDIKYKITYEHSEKRFDVVGNFCEQTVSAVYFYTKEVANNAIEEIIKPFMVAHPDFKW